MASSPSQPDYQPLEPDPQFSAGPPVPVDLPVSVYNPVASGPPIPFSPPINEPPVRPSIDKVWPVAFLAAEVCVLVMAIVNLCLSSWVSWCEWDVSLTNLSNPEDSKSLASFVEECDQWNPFPGCGNMCTIAEDFEASGHVMIALGTVAIALSGQSGLYLLVCLFWPSLKKRLIFTIGLAAAAALWVIAIVNYVGVFINIANGASETRLEVGVELGIAVAVFFIQLAAFGIFVDKKFGRTGIQQNN